MEQPNITYVNTAFSLQTNRLMHVVLLCVTYSLRLTLRSVMARGPLYFIANITSKKLYAPEQDAALQFCSHIFLFKPKLHPGVCGNP